MNRLADTLTGLAFLLALGLLCAILLSTLMVIRRLRRAPRRTYGAAVARNLPGDPSELDQPRAFRTVERTLARRRIATWEIQGDDPNGPIIIASPGWGDSKLGVLPRLPALAPHAARIIAWDPPGLGDSPGLCNLGTRADADCLRELIEHIRADLHDDRAAQPNNAALAQPHTHAIILFGWSLGAGLSIVAACRDESSTHEHAHPPIRAVIAEAPYRRAWTPAFRVMRLAGLPWRINAPIAFLFLGLRLREGPLWPRFDRARWAARLRVPLHIIHGDQDEISPIEDARTIAAAAPEARLHIIPGAHHNDLWDEPFRTAAAETIHNAVRDASPAD